MSHPLNPLPRMRMTCSIESQKWKQLDFSSLWWARKICGLALHHLGKKNTKTMIVGLFLTDDKRIRALNKDYRNQDKATNVLSFPIMQEPPEKTAQPWMIGDIVLSYDTLFREAEFQGKIFKHHYIHMVLHGFLHLLGFDHLTEKDASKMESLETAILEKMNITNPYLTWKDLK